jgi:hypothetical protein
MCLISGRNIEKDYQLYKAYSMCLNKWEENGGGLICKNLTVCLSTVGETWRKINQLRKAYVPLNSRRNMEED